MKLQEPATLTCDDNETQSICETYIEAEHTTARSDTVKDENSNSNRN